MTSTTTTITPPPQATGCKLFCGLFRLHCYWSVHLFLGRPTVILPVGVCSFTKLGMCVSFILNKYCVPLLLRALQSSHEPWSLLRRLLLPSIDTDPATSVFCPFLCLIHKNIFKLQIYIYIYILFLNLFYGLVVCLRLYMLEAFWI